MHRKFRIFVVFEDVEATCTFDSFSALSNLFQLSVFFSIKKCWNKINIKMEQTQFPIQLAFRFITLVIPEFSSYG